MFNQAEQALELPFIGAQGTELRISQVFVISPADCSTSAIESIRDKLLSNRGRVSFICGPALLDLFEKYYPDFLLFQSGLFGSYVAALEREFDNDEPISNALFRSGIPAEARALRSVYVRPSFYQVFHTFKRTVSVPDLSVLNSPVQEEVVSEFRQALRRLGRFVMASTVPSPEGSQLLRDLQRYADDIQNSWRNALTGHSKRRDLTPEERHAPRRTLRFEISESVLLPRGEDLLARCHELLAVVDSQIESADRYVSVNFDSPRAALQCELVRDVSTLDDLEQQVPGDVVRNNQSAKRLELGSDLLELIDQDLLIVGPPGYGKSSFCRAQALHDFRMLREGHSRTWPAYVALHQLANGPLGSFQESILRNSDLIKLWEEAQTTEGTTKRFRVYLDGLDEIPSQERQGEVLTLAKKARQTFPNMQFVVTSREHVRGTHLSGLLRVRIREFDDNQVNEFVSKWFGDDNMALAQFRAQMAQVPTLSEVIRIPLLATLVLSLYRNTMALPESRVSLYEMFVRLLAGGWDIAKRVNRETQFGPTPKLTVLVKLAAVLHIGRRRDAMERDIYSAIKATLPGLKDRGAQMLEEFVQDGFLVPSGLSYTFAHLSFQEFMAAKDLFEPAEKRATYALEQYLTGDDWWREVILFYIALAAKPKQLELFIHDVAKKLLARTGSSVITSRATFLFESIASIFPGSNPSLSLQSPVQLGLSS